MAQNISLDRLLPGHSAGALRQLGMLFNLISRRERGVLVLSTATAHSSFDCDLFCVLPPGRFDAVAVEVGTTLQRLGIRVDVINGQDVAGDLVSHASRTGVVFGERRVLPRNGSTSEDLTARRSAARVTFRAPVPPVPPMPADRPVFGRRKLT